MAAPHIRALQFTLSRVLLFLLLHLYRRVRGKRLVAL
uniref:Uncharacterized protein n=1 Tax=Anguilla anguilla TaxID=7936 RepID=A0A0E9T8K0_ANGAN